MASYSFLCPYCSKLNQFHVEGYLDPTDGVACSGCRRMMGNWQELAGVRPGRPVDPSVAPAELLHG